MTITGAVSRGIRCLSLLSTALPLLQMTLVRFDRWPFEDRPHGPFLSFFRCAALAGVILSLLSLWILAHSSRAGWLVAAHFLALLTCTCWLWILCFLVGPL